MPLVVPGLTLSKDGNDEKTNKWMNELVGKKIGDTSNETVSSCNAIYIDRRDSQHIPMPYFMLYKSLLADLDW